MEITGEVTDVMKNKKKTAEGEPEEYYWKGKIDGKVFNFNTEPDPGATIKVQYDEKEWTKDSGEKMTSRWVTSFEKAEAISVGQEMSNMQQASTFQKGTEVKPSTDIKELMQKCLIDAVVICNNLNDMAAENEAPEIQWTSEDIEKIGVSMFMEICKRDRK